MRQIASIPVVMYSGSTRSVAECYEAGANHFLHKPHSLGAARIISTLNTCMIFKKPRFGLLARLPQYEPHAVSAAEGVTSPAVSFA
jgi:hypothetical protein